METDAMLDQNFRADDNDQSHRIECAEFGTLSSADDPERPAIRFVPTDGGPFRKAKLALEGTQARRRRHHRQKPMSDLAASEQE